MKNENCTYRKKVKFNIPIYYDLSKDLNDFILTEIEAIGEDNCHCSKCILRRNKASIEKIKVELKVKKFIKSLTKEEAYYLLNESDDIYKYLLDDGFFD